MTWTRKDSNDRKVMEGYLDFNTAKAVKRLQEKKIVNDVMGVAKEGKESTIVIATDMEGRKIILKIFKIEASQFQRMQKYIQGDRRFAGIKMTRQSLVYNWCKKEFSNLKRARTAGVNTPEPIAFQKNVLVMEFIGDGELAPKLKDVTLEHPGKMLDSILKEVKKLYKEANLVHADLSEYNILVRHGKPVIHDMAQSVEPSHQMANEFLKRDIDNICKYFEGLGVKRDREKILEDIMA